MTLHLHHNSPVLQEERWVTITEFPNYSVSDRGRVLNENTGVIVKPTKNSQGVTIIGLMDHGIQRKRSLALLVARAFLPHQENEKFDTPIHLDGDRTNNHYMNLAWRPRWFAREYMKQFNKNNIAYDFPVQDVETGEVYKNSMDASMINGVLDSHVRLSMLNNTYVWPTGQVFRDPV